MSGWAWEGIVGGAMLFLLLLHRPLGVLGRLLGRSGLGLAFLWLFQGVGGWLGAHLGVNLLNALVLGALGVPGFALLLMVRWLIS